jgi:hypothetical protein
LATFKLVSYSSSGWIVLKLPQGHEFSASWTEHSGVAATLYRMPVSTLNIVFLNIFNCIYSEIGQDCALKNRYLLAIQDRFFFSFNGVRLAVKRITAVQHPQLSAL